MSNKKLTPLMSSFLDIPFMETKKLYGYGGRIIHTCKIIDNKLFASNGNKLLTNIHRIKSFRHFLSLMTGLGYSPLVECLDYKYEHNDYKNYFRYYFNQHTLKFSNNWNYSSVWSSSFDMDNKKFNKLKIIFSTLKQLKLKNKDKTSKEYVILSWLITDLKHLINSALTYGDKFFIDDYLTIYSYLKNKQVEKYYKDQEQKSNNEVIKDYRNGWKANLSFHKIIRKEKGLKAEFKKELKYV